MSSNPKDDKAATVKTLKATVEQLQTETAEIRAVAAQVGRDLTDSEKKVVAENDATISAANADIAALEKTPESLDERIAALQVRRGDLAEESRSIKRVGQTRPLTEDERRTLQSNDTVIAEIDHAVTLLEREQFDSLPADERVKALTEERDDLAKADADAGTHLNDAVVARKTAEITSLNAEIAAEAAAKDAAAKQPAASSKGQP